MTPSPLLDWQEQARRFAMAFDVSEWEVIGCNVRARSVELLGLTPKRLHVQVLLGLSGDWLFSVAEFAQVDNWHAMGVWAELVSLKRGVEFETYLPDEYFPETESQCVEALARAAICLEKPIDAIERDRRFTFSHTERQEWIEEFKERRERLAALTAGQEEG